MKERKALTQTEPSAAEWVEGLTAMRRVMLADASSDPARGPYRELKGVMPGIAEEALLSLRAGQPLFLAGGFGGCARDIAESLGILAKRPMQTNWAMRDAFTAFTAANLNNGLTDEENVTLATTPHIDQAVTLILRGLLRAENPGHSIVETP